MSNLLDKASIILTPTAYNNGKALCVKPSDGSGDFDFSRNSAATRVNAQGLVENVQILSSNLVQNGDFSEEGSEEVSNGSFSQEGVELVTNGDFATDTDWTKQTEWSISNGKAIANSSNGSIYQPINFIDNKSYKITFDITEYTSGEVACRFNDDVTNTYNSVGTHTLYFVSNNSFDYVYFLGLNSFTGSIDNVSVREVGQEWEIQNGWSIGDDVAVFSGTVSAYRTIYQQSILTIGKTYKLTFDIVSISSGSIENISQSNPTSYNTQGTITEYFTASNIDLFLKPTTDADCSITNISVKEVGQNWNLQTGWQIGNNVASYDDLTDNAILSQAMPMAASKKYKLSFTILNGSGARMQFTDNAGLALYNLYGEGNLSNGDYSFIFNTASSVSGFRLYAYTLSGGAFDITNISVIEITDDTNLPRINYEGFSFDGSGNIIPNSGCGSWLFEPQSTNTVTYSEDFSQWNKLGAAPVLTTGQLSPSGELNATKISGTIGSTFLNLGASSSITATRTIYAKTVTGTGTACLLSHNSNTNNLFTLTEDWQRFELTGSNATGGTAVYIDFRNNTQTLSEIIVWGAQSEELTYATSYIPTSGSTVTRNQDLCTNGGSLATINSTEGTLYFEGSVLANNGTYRLISLNDGTINNTVYIGYDATANRITFAVRVATSFVFLNHYDITNSTDVAKIALKYKENDFALWYNGVLILADTSGVIFPINTLTKLSFDRGGSLPFYGKTKALAVWKEALSDEELAELTTI